MKIDLSGIVRNDGAFVDFDMEEDLSCLRDIREDCRFGKPVRFSGRITNDSGLLRLKGRIETSYDTDCCRCTKPVKEQVDIPVAEEISRTETGDEIQSSYAFKGEQIVLDPIVKDNIVLNLPMRHLCAADCRGLCHRCGIDLNEGECDCLDDDTDPRLEILKDYFSDSGN